MKPTLIKSKSAKLHTFTFQENYTDMVLVMTIETLGLYSLPLRDANKYMIQDVPETDYRAAMS